MVHSFILPKETIASIQERLKKLERSLNEANVENEAIAGLIELANDKQISLIPIPEKNETDV